MRRLIPDREVRERYKLSSMGLWRWDHDSNLNFPKPVWIRGRKYRDEAELAAFDRACIEARAGQACASPPPQKKGVAERRATSTPREAA